MLLLITTSLHGEVIRMINISPPAGDVTQIVEDPGDAQNLYAVVGEQLYRSRNSGFYWQPMSLRDVVALNTDPAGKRIFAETFDRFSTPSTRFKFWVSTDKATTFQNVATLQPNVFLRAIFPHPVLQKVIFGFGCNGWDVCVSGDSGKTWHVFRNLPPGEANYDNQYYASGLVFARDNDNQIFLSGRYERHYRRPIHFLAKTDNLGESWKQIQPKEFRFLQHFNKILAYGGTGVYEYVGKIWRRISSEKLMQMIGASDDPKQLWGIAGSVSSYDRTLVQSSDNGITWQKVELPFADALLLGYADKGGLLLGSQGGGFYRFTKGNWNWSGRGIKSSASSSISFSKVSQVLLTEQYKFLQAYNAKERTWIDLSWSLPRKSDEYFERIVVDPFDANNIFLLTTNRLLQSTNGGKNWKELPSAIPVYDSYRSRIVYLFATNRTLFKSTDSGKTFYSFPLKCSQCPRYMSGMTVDPFDERVLYFTMPSGIWKSIDGGLTIQKTGKVSSGVLAALPFRNQYLLLSKEGNLFKTTTGGKEWKKFASLGAVNNYSSQIKLLVLDTKGKVIAAVHNNLTLFLSFDSGHTWIRPLSSRFEVLDIAANAKMALYVSTTKGLFKIEVR